MIKLIVGLGNPGQQYKKTRHNAGFLFLDHLLNRISGTWVNEAKFHAIISTSLVAKHRVILLKPQTFVNKSGLSVGLVARYYQLKTEEIMVVHDDLDFSVGTVKLKKGGGHAGHNGLRDIMQNLGDKNFYRARLGIGRPVSVPLVVDYVLSNPSKQDQNLMLSAFDLLESQIDTIVADDIATAMNVLNKY